MENDAPLSQDKVRFEAWARDRLGVGKDPQKRKATSSADKKPAALTRLSKGAAILKGPGGYRWSNDDRPVSKALWGSLKAEGYIKSDPDSVLSPETIAVHRAQAWVWTGKGAE